MLRQRVYGLALGHEDLNDHTELRHDVAMQTAVECDGELASAPTLCRLENQADRDWAWHVHKVLFAMFVEAHPTPPEEIVLDFDTTNDEVHGEQVGRAFHGYYDQYCFLPLHVFVGDHLLVSYMQRADIGPATRAAGILRLLVRNLRQVWPETRIVMRADSAFCVPHLLRWCDRNDVDYILGLGSNNRVAALAAPGMAEAKAASEAAGEKLRRFADVRYGAETWDRERRVVARLEHGPMGANPRFVVTSLEGTPQEHLREGVLRPRRDGEPHQGAAGTAVLRPHLLP